ncbi:hypothetical protein WJX72_004615 [[Myrmecia] bisecta]|uniref:Uncharacterized protein n=1 Tax=[Myrmecia] bisecta TaxID=41462 RepID=A0AAW1PNY9_9CHLO
MTESFHHHWSPAPSSPQRSKLGPRSPTTPGSPSLPLASRASDFAGFNAGSPKAPFARSRSVNRTSSLKYSATAEEDIMELLEDGISLMPTSMPRPPTSSMAPRPSPLNIPRLTLPLAHSPSLTAGGLTRSTRRSLQTERTMGLTPSGSQRFPTPPDSFREVEQSERVGTAVLLLAPPCAQHAAGLVIIYAV